MLAAAPAGDYERALYLYDWLLTHVRYVARETYDQTAYAAVCEGEAVCGGIADAYVYLLERGGIPARVITGTSRSADGTADSHAWVAAELDGAVYYFDPTWDLQDDESEAALPGYLSHTWFALTAERMAVRHTADDPTLWPDSRANADNYYVRSGYTAAEATVAAAAAAVRSQWDDGRASAGVSLRDAGGLRRHAVPALRTRPALGCLPRARQLRVLVRLPVRGRPADHPPYPRTMSLPPAGGKRCEAF
ncbi:MAG: transglutaminase domain-containing protein [Oscillospiraceae bacterium]